MKEGIVYTTGYTGKKPDDLKALVDRLGARLVDVRFSPHSRWAKHWERDALIKLLGPAYYHLVHFGNQAFKQKRIEIFDFFAGMRWLSQHFVDNPNQPVILMCGCKEYQTCHRKELSERLQLMNYHVEELSSWTQGQDSFFSKWERVIKTM